eukprot:c7250_g1_i1.p1 GENE.c7250_g1_i1~~c7250_g1_i1.p1  ORF type:complete len:596 (-),score=160.65 c7250_g1_i1:614-2401(-)
MLEVPSQSHTAAVKGCTIECTSLPVGGDLQAFESASGAVVVQVDETRFESFGGSCDRQSAAPSTVFSFSASSLQATTEDNSSSIPYFLGHTVSQVGRNIVVFGGTDGKQLSSSVYILDTVQNQWSMPHLSGTTPQARHHHSAVVQSDADVIVVFAGATYGATCLNDIVLLSVLSADKVQVDLPTVQGSCPTDTSRQSHTACVVRNAMYIFGGCSQSPGKTDPVFLNDLLYYGFDSQQMVAVEGSGSVPSPRAGACMCAINERAIAVMGGYNPANPPSTASPLHIFDIDKYTWTNPKFTGAALGHVCTPVFLSIFRSIPSRDTPLLLLTSRSTVAPSHTPAAGHHVAYKLVIKNLHSRPRSASEMSTDGLSNDNYDEEVAILRRRFPTVNAALITEYLRLYSGSIQDTEVALKEKLMADRVKMLGSRRPVSVSLGQADESFLKELRAAASTSRNTIAAGPVERFVDDGDDTFLQPAAPSARKISGTNPNTTNNTVNTDNTYQTDLTFTEDGNPNFITGPDGTKLINVFRHRLVSDIIVQIKTFQDTAYDLHPVPQIAKLLDALPHPDPRDQNKLATQYFDRSLKLEPRSSERSAIL